MKFGNFLFPQSSGPSDDYRAVTEALNESILSEQLGYDEVWLGEHHLDGACAYVDPIAFAGTVVGHTTKIGIGFSAVQMALHHPTRLAEQISLLDNLSKGRITLGIGRGTAFNFYEYRAYGIPFKQAQDRLLESEEILTSSWTNKTTYRHKGKHFNLEMPQLRPAVYTKPHPPLIRALATEETLLEMARLGRPFMMVVQSDEETIRLFHKYQEMMRISGHEENLIKKNLAKTRIWRNIVVAESDEEAAERALPAFREYTQHIRDVRENLNTPEELESVRGNLDNPRFTSRHNIIYGSPSTVSKRISQLSNAGVGGLILHFRVGTLSQKHNEESLRLFSSEVIPTFRNTS